MATNHQLLTLTLPALALAAVAAGTGDTQTFTEVNMAPQFEGIQFIAMIGTITSTGTATLQAKGSNVSATYGAGTVGLFTHVDTGNIIEAQAATGDSGTLISIDIFKPGTATVGGISGQNCQYVRGQIVRATANVVITGVISVLYTSQIGSVIQTGMATHGTVYTNTTTAGFDIGSNPALSLS